MTHKSFKTLSALLLALATVPATHAALADQADSGMFGQPLAKLAQLSPDERRAMRERWEQASPEERIRMREFFQNRMRQLPGPAQEALRLPFPGMPMRDVPREREEQRRAGPSPDSSFGFGFERRRSEDGQSDRSMPPGGRRFNDDERR